VAKGRTRLATELNAFLEMLSSASVRSSHSKEAPASLADDLQKMFGKHYDIDEVDTGEVMAEWIRDGSVIFHRAPDFSAFCSVIRSEFPRACWNETAFLRLLQRHNVIAPEQAEALSTQITQRAEPPPTPRRRRDQSRSRGPSTLSPSALALPPPLSPEDRHRHRRQAQSSAPPTPSTAGAPSTAAAPVAPSSVPSTAAAPNWRR